MKQFIFFILFCCSSVHILAETIRCEAENAQLSGGNDNFAQIESDVNCSGGKYVNTREGNIAFTFTISSGGDYHIIAKAKSPSGNKINTFRFDKDHSKEISFSKSDDFREITVADSYYLSAGSHTIEMIKSWGWIQFDYLEIRPSSVAVEFDIQPLVTPQPSENVAKLYQFFKDNFQRKVISGVMTSKSMTKNNQNEILWLYEQTGVKPALMGLDIGDYINYPTGWRNNPDLIEDAIAWHNMNGFVSMSWHWRDPSRNTYDFYSDKTQFDARKIFEPQSEEYKAMIRDMDDMARYLKILQDADVPVLWRPLHEASGKWFWWGAKGADACKKIWHIMFNKFVNEHKLNNLIWVWTSEADAGTLSWYPGDDYVDMIGLDFYKQGDHSSQKLLFTELKKMFNGKKMLAFTESGSIPEMNAMKNDQAIWSHYLVWSDHAKDANWNTVQQWKSSLSNPDVITLGDIHLPTSTTENELDNNFQIAINQQQLLIQTQSPDVFQLYLYDINGNLCLFQEGLLGNQTINLSNLNKAYYLLSIKNEQGKKTIKIVFK